MTKRMAKLDQILQLARLLADSGKGLTDGEIAVELGAHRRLPALVRDVITRHFDLQELPNDRAKRFCVRSALRSVYILLRSTDPQFALS